MRTARRRLVRRSLPVAVAAAAAFAAAVPVTAGATQTGSFRDIDTLSIPGGSAEIADATRDGKTVLYTDADGTVGFVDISDPRNMILDGDPVDVGGSPTSVAVSKDGKYAFVGVQTTKRDEGEPPEITPGNLVVIEIATRQIVHRVDIGWGPDSVAAAAVNGVPLAVVAIENEPLVTTDGTPAGNVTDDEDPGNPNDIGGPGLVQVVAFEEGGPRVIDVPLDLAGTDLLFKDDPQPEFVDVQKHKAAVSLQENNGIAIIDLKKALGDDPADAVKRIFSTGTVEDRPADLVEDDDISFTQTYPSDVADEDNAGARFPDAVSWTKDGYIISADEGEANFTGGRGWSIWNPKSGEFVWDDGGQLERQAVRHGQYPEGRSENKGIEIEGADAALYGGREFAFLASERGSFLAVYRMRKGKAPKLVQLLPTGVGPEGVLPIPQRNLLLTADEESGNLRLFRGQPHTRGAGTKKRPVITSRGGVDEPFSAISGLTADARHHGLLWGVPDNALPSALYRFKVGGRTTTLVSRPVTKDGEQQRYDLEGIAVDSSIASPENRRAQRHHKAVRRHREALKSERRSANPSKRVMARHAKAMRRHKAALSRYHGFWLAQEGNADFGEDGYRPNLLIQVGRGGKVLREIPLPEAIDSPSGGVIRGNGFEGVTVSDDGRHLLAAIQREYSGEPEVAGHLHTRIARYDLVTKEWDFFLYPLEPSQNDGWVGLSEITNLGHGRYAVIERDQGLGGDAFIKRIYEFTLDGVEPTDGSPLPEGITPADADGKVITKTLLKDVLPATEPFEKFEGLALTPKRVLWGINDNDGGEFETRPFQLGKVGKQATKPAPFTLTILHHNDSESEQLPGDEAGGVARFATKVAQEKARALAMKWSTGRSGSLTVSAGDNFLAGTEIEASFSNGVPFFESTAMNLIGYDAAVIGNHEFDFGPDVAADFMTGVDAPTSGTPAIEVPKFLSANLDVSGEPKLQALVDAGRIAPSTVVTIRGTRVGVVGATTETLPFVSSPRNVIVNQVVPAVQAEIDRLKADGVDIIIVASHLQGIGADREVAAELRHVDALVAGGGDELLANDGDELLVDDAPVEPYPVSATDKDGNLVPIVTGPGEYRYIGRLVLHFDHDGKVIGIGDESGPQANFPASDPRAVEPNQAVVDRVEAPVAAFQADLATTVIATSAVGLNGVREDVRSTETNQGNLIADAYLSEARRLAPTFGQPEADIAVVNGGGIRNNDVRGPGAITALDTFDMLPFGNKLALVDQTPAELKDLFENAVSRANPDETSGTGRFLQVAGLTLTYDPAGAPRAFDGDGNVTFAGSRVVSIVLADGTAIVDGGAPVAGAPDVTMAIPDFLARGGDQFPLTEPDSILGQTGQQSLSNFIVNELGGAISGGGPYEPGGEDRIVRLGS